MCRRRVWSGDLGDGVNHSWCNVLLRYSVLMCVRGAVLDLLAGFVLIVVIFDPHGYFSDVLP